MATPYQTSLALVSVKLPRGVALVLPMRAQWLRDTLAKLKPLRPWKLTSVRTGARRRYPQWRADMTTRAYCDAYWSANGLHFAACPFDCERFDEVPAMLDPAAPDVEQLPDADDTTNAQGVTW